MGVAASLPEDVLDKAACWLERNDLLCQRAASPSARDAAQRAIAKKANPHVLKISFGFGLGGLGPGSTPKELLEAPQSVVAMGNVFGAGCVELDAAGVSAQSVAALRSFVNATKHQSDIAYQWRQSTNACSVMVPLACTLMRIVLMNVYEKGH